MGPVQGAVVQTVILAAGTGSRLDRSGSAVPKPLATVGGVPLIAHALLHAVWSGCRTAIVVVGHEGHRVRAAVEAMMPSLQVRFVETPDPSAPNGHSLLAAEHEADSHFFLQMVDHLFSEVVLPKLVATPLGDEMGRVLVDRRPDGLDLDDATKVRLSGTRVTAIGKSIEPWDAIDAGCFVLTREVFTALRDVPGDEPRTVSSGMRQLVRREGLFAMDVGAVRWADVDTPADREHAERLVAAITASVPAAPRAPSR